VKLFDLRLEAVTGVIARRASEQLPALPPGIDVVDRVIAATAELQAAELLTLNVKHFPMVRGLKPAFS